MCPAMLPVALWHSTPLQLFLPQEKQTHLSPKPRHSAPTVTLSPVCSASNTMYSYKCQEMSSFNPATDHRLVHTHSVVQFLSGGRKNKTVFVTNGKQVCSTLYATKNTAETSIGEYSFESFSIRTDVLHGIKTLKKVKSQVTGRHVMTRII